MVKINFAADLDFTSYSDYNVYYYSHTGPQKSAVTLQKHKPVPVH